MAVKRIATPNKWVGAASDTKPTMALYPGRVRVGDTFYERDTDLLYITYDGTNWVIKQTLPLLKEIRTAVDIGSTDCCSFAVGDILGNDDCCTTKATAWTFTEVARANGGYGRIIGATLVCDEENQAVQYDLLLFNTKPTNTLLSNSANDNPQKEDISLYIGTIVFPISTGRGSDVATYTQATPASTSTNLPMAFKCATTVDDIYGVLVTRTAYSHTEDDTTIEIALLVEQW